MRKVVKFGGSSLASAEQFQKVKAIITADKARRFVVPSAPGKRDSGDTKVTDMLYQCYDAACNGGDYQSILARIRGRYQDIIDGLGLELSLDAEFAKIEENFLARAGRDYAASRGEYLNGIVMANYLGYPFVDAADVIRFDDHGTFLADETNEMMAARVGTMECAVVPGFYGAKADGTIVTFSRGGSDVTGSVVSRGIGADMYENWTDVNGFLVTDPRIVNNPAPIGTITYRELRELSYMGAGVLHEDAIFPVRKAGIPINIKNTNCPEDPGTMIVETTSKKTPYTITGIAGKKGFCSILIEKAMMNAEVGFGLKVLQVLDKYGIPFEHIPSGIDSMSVFVHQSEFSENEQAVLAGIHRAVHPDLIDIQSDLALIAVVGRGIRTNRGVAAKLFTALAEEKINIRMIDQGSGELNIIIGVHDSDFEAAIQAIYRIFVTEA